MSAFFTDFFRQQLFANQNLMNGATVGLVFFRQAPGLIETEGQWIGYKTTDELNTTTAWQELDGIPGYPMEQTIIVSKREILTNNYVMFSEFPFSLPPDGLEEPAPIAAIGVELITATPLAGVTNPLIFVTDTPTSGWTNVFPADALTANEDTDNITTGDSRYMFSWADPPAGATDWPSIFPTEGPLTLFRAAPPFEPSNTLHVWMYPQRANMIANPSFEAPGVDYWAPAGERVHAPALRSKGSVADSGDLITLDPVVGDVYQAADDGHLWQYKGPDPNDNVSKWNDLGVPTTGAWGGKFTGAAPFAIESNIWPTRMADSDSELWTFQLMAQGDGDVKVGLVFWDADYRGTNVDWGTEKWQLQPDAWIHIACVRYGAQAHTAMMRIEVDGTEITIDNVLAERGALKEWPYFDGDEKYGALDDYSWYGGPSRQGRSYSMWYGGRRAVMGRLFASPVQAEGKGDLLTDTEVMAAGMVYNWIPAGASVIPHIDVFYPNDLRSPPPLRSSETLPYNDADPDGVVNPWV